MTQEELLSARRIWELIGEREKELQHLRALRDVLTPILDGMPKAQAPKSRLEEVTIKILDAQRELEDLHEQLTTAQAELEEKIWAQVESPQLKTIALLRYVECRPWAQVATLSRFDLRYVFKLNKNLFRTLDGS